MMSENPSRKKSPELSFLIRVDLGGATHRHPSIQLGLSLSSTLALAHDPSDYN